MRILYFIFKENEWQSVDYDTYKSFEGRKEIRPPHYGLILLQKYLQPYRY